MARATRVPRTRATRVRLIAAFALSMTLVQDGVAAQVAPSASPVPADSSPPAVEPNSAFADPSQPIKVHLNKMFMIALDASPSTGYRWVQHGDLDASVLRFLNAFYLAPDTAAMGAPGHEIRMYWAGGLGDAAIDLDYVAPAKNGTVGKSVHFDVTVDP